MGRRLKKGSRGSKVPCDIVRKFPEGYIVRIAKVFGGDGILRGGRKWYERIVVEFRFVRDAEVGR